MQIIHVTPSNASSQSDKLNTHIKDKKHAFVLFYLQGCGPCNATRPEWEKVPHHLEHHAKNPNLMIADVDQSAIDHVKHNSGGIDGFPTIRHIKGDEVNEYSGERTAEGLAKWMDKSVQSDFSNSNSKSDSKSNVLEIENGEKNEQADDVKNRGGAKRNKHHSKRTKSYKRTLKGGCKSKKIKKGKNGKTKTKSNCGCRCKMCRRCVHSTRTVRANK